MVIFVGIWGEVEGDERVEVSHLLFANNILVFYKATQSQMTH